MHLFELGPCYMVSGTRDNPPPKATLSSVYMWKRSPVGRVKADFAWLFTTLIGYQMYRYPSFFEFFSVIRSQWVLPSKFSLLWYEFLLSIRNLSITWPSPGRELSLLGEPKRLYEEKLSRFPGLPYLPRWDSLTRVVSPPETGSRSWCKRFVDFAKE